MAKKYQIISELYEHTCNKVITSEEEWKAFLKCACRNYKLRFDEQILVYAQKPESTAVLEIEKWNDRFGRWVNKGASGIAVFADENRNSQMLNHYFDISDTHTGIYTRKVPMWQMSKRYEQNVINTIKTSFNLTAPISTLHGAILRATEDSVKDNLSSYIKEFSYITQGKLSEETLPNILIKTISNSAAYTVLTRLGYDADTYMEASAFEFLPFFNERNAVDFLGVKTSTISKTTLLTISSAVIPLQRAEEILKNNNYLERNIEHGRNENNIHTPGRLQSSESEATATTESGIGILRNETKGVFEGGIQRDIHDINDALQINRTLGTERTGSFENGRNLDKADDAETRSNRGTEGDKPNDLGWNDEQHSQQRAGNSFDRDNLRFVDIYDPQYEDKVFDPLVNEDIIREIFIKTPHLKESKNNINLFFESNSDVTARTEYIKDVFNNDYTEVILNNDIRAGYKSYKNGLLLWEGGYTSRTKQVFYQWSIVTQYFEAMHLLDELHDEIKPLRSADTQFEVLNDLLSRKNSFHFTQKFIDRTLCKGSGFEKGKMRIYKQFTQGFSKKENIAFLRKEYGWGGSSPVIIGTRISLLHDNKGMTFSKNIGNEEVKLTLTWDKVETRIAELIKHDRYLNPKEKELYQKWNEETLSSAPVTLPQTNESTNVRYEYHLGDTVYIGADSYEILSFDDNRVMLFDSKCPIINEEMERSTFDRLVSENPMNDHLKSAVEHIAVSDLIKETIEETSLNPQYKEYLSIKAEHPNNIVFFQIGDFFEAYNEDAKTISDVLVLSTASRSINDEQRVPMIGLPKHRMKKYIEKITEKGHDVVIAALEDTERKLYYANHVETEILLSTHKDPTEIQTQTDVHVKPEENLISSSLVLADSTKRNVRSTDLHPDIPMSERHNFDLSVNKVEEVGKKERFRRNINAIRILKTCKEENRFASPEEQIILSKYVGWGGIPEAFDDHNTSWEKEYAELHAALSSEEYELARESTLTAFYTPPTVIQAIYKAMEQMGFREGNILEPACGIGHFMGMIPASMENSKIYGVEIDTISASIAQQLYQKNTIAVQAFEKTQLHDSFFDAVIGNVPFGDFKVIDKKYDKYNFLIHDYFFAKSLDKLRPGGIMAFITSMGTMDKENPAIRRYIAQRAELLGAIRLPNNTFKGNAGTEVVSDIIFLQKRDRVIEVDEDWLYLKQNSDGIKINSYFAEHPEMILGTIKRVSGRFGEETSCLPVEGTNLEELLNDAIKNIHGEVTAVDFENELAETDNSVPADPNVRNFSYTILEDTVYFREHSRMKPITEGGTKELRIKGMIAVRDSARRLLELQKENYSDEEIKTEQANLNNIYDEFSKKYGLLNSKANASAFQQDSSYPLLASLEHIDENGKLKRKADIFFKRTIRPRVPVTSVDSSIEALSVSLGERGYIDMDYMKDLSGKTEAKIFDELKGVIFLNPLYDSQNSIEEKYLTADNYLSGNVREKLSIAKKAAQINSTDFAINVESLEKVQPINLTASEISVRLGATWIPKEIVRQFIFEFLDTPRYTQLAIHVNFSKYTGEWNIEGKTRDKWNLKANSTYGTSRINAYKIIEETLNLKDVRIFDYIEDERGNKKPVLNKKETAIALSKQELIKQGFQDWIWKDHSRRERLTKMYNEAFNCIRPREYDGSNIQFVGMNAEIQLRPHQKNAIAHILYGGNTLLAHAVGAGKTFEMTAAAMESKRHGLCNKSLFVVPNHLTEQWASEFLQLYPSANILVARKKDFEPQNRKKFCGRIATGAYDAIIIGHSQFEKIPMSIEHQKSILDDQLNEITEGIAELKRHNGDSFSVKQLEITKKSVKQKLEKLNDQSRKDNVITFEELGVDRIFVDESHYYKNLFLFTKMRNVGGIAQTEAQKSSDLFMKCRYLDKITHGRGVVFATGTPISNSMVELYTIQRYLQYDTLVKNNLQHFDAWASTFGETTTAVELTPEGTGYRAKTRFAKFYNLPELMSMFKEIADIKTADMLDLPVPKVNYHTISVKPSEYQKKMVAELSERAERVRNGMVNPTVDNMLKITNDGRKLALDQRLINPALPDYEGSKLNACVDALFETWEKGKEKKLTQLFFCDLSTPKNNDEFSVYTDIRNKLIQRGISEKEIQFIHDANTEAKKDELFKKVRIGDVRILMGSTSKMGAGTNVQNKLVASHDLDCPWRPSDLEQRLGRTVRQGNENAEVHINRFVTEGTFDAYLYQIIEQKQRFVSQIMTSKSPVRTCEDTDETALSYAEIKMLATGNPLIKEKMDLDIQVQKLQLLKSNYLSEKYNLEDKIIKYYPQEIARRTVNISNHKTDIEFSKQHPKPDDDSFAGIQIGGIEYDNRTEAGNAIFEICKSMKQPDPIVIGKYRGFNVELSFNIMTREFIIKLLGNSKYEAALGTDAVGNLIRLDNLIKDMPKRLQALEEELENVKKQLEIAKNDVQKPFTKEEELKEKSARLNELNILLNMDKKDNIVIDENEVNEEAEHVVEDVTVSNTKTQIFEKEPLTQAQLKSKLRNEVNNVISSMREDPKEIAEYMIFAARFKHNSHKNLILIYAQNKKASFVARRMAYLKGLPNESQNAVYDKISVKSDEKAIFIYNANKVLCVRSNDNEEFMPFESLPQSKQELSLSERWEQKFKTEYILTPVYDISQTDFPKDLYSELCYIPSKSEYDSEFIVKSMQKYLKDTLNCDIAFVPDIEDKQGFFSSSDNTIKIYDKLSENDLLSVILQQSARAEIYHSTNNISQAEKKLSEDLYAMMLQSKFGIDITDVQITECAKHYQAYLLQVQANIADNKTIDSNPATEVFSMVISKYQEKAPVIDEYLKRKEGLEHKCDTDVALSQQNPSQNDRQETKNTYKVTSSKI